MIYQDTNWKNLNDHKSTKACMSPYSLETIHKTRFACNSFSSINVPSGTSYSNIMRSDDSLVDLLILCAIVSFRVHTKQKKRKSKKGSFFYLNLSHAKSILQCNYFNVKDFVTI